jgi:NAD+ kinase
MKNAYLIISNPDRDMRGVYTERVKKALKENGAEICNINEAPDGKPEVKAIIVLGGDGTLMRTADVVKDFGAPILGINTGTLGYLTGAETENLETAIKKLVQGDYRIENRMMLDISVNGEKTETVLNDAVVTRNGYSRIIRLKVKINGKEIFTAGGDGIIISTPTGSTGYNLSAGGSICVPEAEMIIITPICPHSMTARSIIASASDEIEIEVPAERNFETPDLGMTLDGRAFIPLKSGDSIRIRRSESITRLIKTDESTFFEALKSKLS